MKQNKIAIPKIIFATTAALLVLLVFLWIRENGRALAAEAKLKDLEEKVETLRNEKNDVTSELQNEVDDLTAKLKEAGQAYNQLMAQKNEELNKLTVLREQESADHVAELKRRQDEVGLLEAQSKADADKFMAQNKQKNEEMSDLGSKLQEVSAKLAACLKSKEVLEAQNAVGEQKIAELKRDFKKLEQHNHKLLKTIQSGKDRPATLD